MAVVGVVAAADVVKVAADAVVGFVVAAALVCLLALLSGLELGLDFVRDEVMVLVVMM
jgi:hypothetical protein